MTTPEHRLTELRALVRQMRTRPSLDHTETRARAWVLNRMLGGSPRLEDGPRPRA